MLIYDVLVAVAVSWLLKLPVVKKKLFDVGKKKTTTVPLTIRHNMLKS